MRGVMLVRRSEWSGHVTVPKGGRGRRVPMTERLAAALQAHRRLRGPRVLYADDVTVPTVPTPRSSRQLEVEARHQRELGW